MTRTDASRMLSTPYRQCVRCVMDTSDRFIAFDDAGVCNHCRHFDRVTRKNWHPDEVGAQLWRREVNRIRAASGPGSAYDCAIGLSGGLDSASLVLLAAEAGLNPLIIHVDAGWNSELAVANIERVLDATGFDLFTVVVDWESMRDLQLAYLRAGVINQDVPQDQAFTAGVLRTAESFGIRDVINGHNIATESILPMDWGWPPLDTRNLRAVHDEFGDGRPLLGYPMLTLVESFRLYSPFSRLRFLSPLNWFPYDRQASIERLSTIGWRPYPRKHGESRFTVFYQEYFLPRRFGVDKRLAHYSSMILAGQMTREEALQALEAPMFTTIDLEIEKDFFSRKLRIGADQVERFMTMPIRDHASLPNMFGPQGWLRKVKIALRR